MRTRPGRNGGRDERVGAGIALAVLLAELVVGVGGGVAAPVPSIAPAAGPRPELTVEPTTFWTTSGNATELTATWVAALPGCSIAPLWYRWSISGVATVGRLNATNGSSTTFLAQAQSSGAAEIAVVAAARVTCVSAATAAVGFANVSARVDAPLAVRGLSVAPNPVPANATASLDGTIVGGVAPYNVSVAWGDGVRSSGVLAAAGAFAFARTLSAGPYVPTVTVTDADGTQVSATATASVVVTAGFAIGLVPSDPTVDVGVPVRIVIVTYGIYQTLVLSVDCGNGADGIPSQDGSVVSFLCVYEVPGPENVTALAILEGSTPWANVTANLTETVVADPTLAVGSGATAAEVGVPFSPAVEIAGGVPPYSLDWRIEGTDANETATADFDGALPIAITPAEVGDLTVEVGATDAIGTVVPPVALVVPVAAALLVTAAAAGAVTNGTPILEVGAGVSGGVPPYDWAVEAAGENASIVGGTLDGPGALAWNGSGGGEGAHSAGLIVIDAVGAFEVDNLSATPIAPLTVGPVLLAATDGNWTLSVPIAGGIPPYRLWANASDGFVWNASNLTPGVVELSAPLPAARTLSVALLVDDALGVSVTANGSLALPAPAAASGGSALGASALGAIAGAAGVLGAAAAVVRRHRRRARVPPGPPVDPVAVLRRLIEPADGADRGTVELLAAEEGIAPDDVRRTLDRLIAERQVRAGRGADGEEILAWEDPR